MKNSEKRSDQGVKALKKSLLPEVDDRDEISRLLIFETEKLTEEAFSAKKLAYQQEQRELLSGAPFTIYEKQEEFKRFISDQEKNYEPKFRQFFKSLGDLMNWTDEERKKFRKPSIAPLTINEVIYRRFPDGLLEYIHVHNRYIGYCIRRTKNYKLLNEGGILKLEKYIDEANSVMPGCADYYEFRLRMYELHKVPYQTDLFRS